jgi:hypothetical protein
MRPYILANLREHPVPPRSRLLNRLVLLCAATFASLSCMGQTPASAPVSKSPVSITVYDRTRLDVFQWFAAPPYANTYGYLESLLRVGIAQKHKTFDWKLELTQPSVLFLPNDAVSPVSAQGQLGLGGTYYASNNNQTENAAAALKQGFIRFDGSTPGRSLRVGRFEFFDGEETTPKNPELKFLQTSRIAQRLVGNFGFSNAQRSFDGVDGHYDGKTWNLTAMAARSDQGVFNMNANPELNVDLQYLAYSKYDFSHHFLWRVFAMGYHDGRTGLTKTDNRALAVRQTDHKNIRLGSYGADFLTSIPAGGGKVDLLGWGVLQNGDWGLLNQRSGAVAVEGGYHATQVRTAPWVRAGFLRSTGDNNATDDQHNTFFQVLPTPRVYARFPFYNMMNSKDQFVQLMDKPAKHLAVRSDMHFLQLTSNKDLWYQGGGAFDNKVFGFVGRPANLHSSFASVFDVSADYEISKNLALTAYYAHAWGKSVVAAIYPVGHSAQYGYIEMTYRWGEPQRPMK